MHEFEEVPSIVIFVSIKIFRTGSVWRKTFAAAVVRSGRHSAFDLQESTHAAGSANTLSYDHVISTSPVFTTSPGIYCVTYVTPALIPGVRELYKRGGDVPIIVTLW